MIAPLIGMVPPPCSRDLVSPEGVKLEVVDMTFVRESSKVSLRIPKRIKIDSFRKSFTSHGAETSPKKTNEFMTGQFQIDILEIINCNL